MQAWISTVLTERSGRGIVLGLLLLAGAAPVLAEEPATVGVCRGSAPPAIAEPDPFHIALVPTAHANGSEGSVRLRFASSPFGLTVTPEGHHLYDLELSVRGLSPREGVSFVVWAATPALDQVRRLGVLDGRGRLSARIAFNKFLVFVTAEPHADVERWSGPILLRGISRSGLMHTMAGHGPFEGEPCE